MGKKIKSLFKYWSCIFIPLVVCVTMMITEFKLHFIQEINYKIDNLSGVAATLIGVLFTVLTIYLSFPKNEVILKRLKISGHDHVFISNMLMGIALYLCSILSWLLFSNIYFPIYTFCCGCSNLIISVYYITVLSRIR